MRPWLREDVDRASVTGHRLSRHSRQEVVNYSSRVNQRGLVLPGARVCVCVRACACKRVATTRVWITTKKQQEVRESETHLLYIPTPRFGNLRPSSGSARAAHVVATFPASCRVCRHCCLLSPASTILTLRRRYALRLLRSVPTFPRPLPSATCSPWREPTGLFLSRAAACFCSLFARYVWGSSFSSNHYSRSFMITNPREVWDYFCTFTTIYHCNFILRNILSGIMIMKILYYTTQIFCEEIKWTLSIATLLHVPP